MADSECDAQIQFFFLKTNNFVLQVKLDEIEMIPKSGKSPADSRKSAGIHEFAALARSSLNGDDLSSTSLVIIYML